MNLLAMTGNLGQDCKTNNVSGTAVCNFSVAMKAGFGDKAQTLWVDCALWGKAAEGKLPEYLTKGQQVAVTGELSTREYEGKTYLQLRCNSVDLIGKKDDSQSAPSQPATQPQQPAPQPAPPNPPSGDDFNDDIPFASMHNMMGG